MDTAGCADTRAGTANRIGLIERSAARDGSGSPSRDAIAAWLAAKVAGPLGIRPDEVDMRRPLAGFGIGSLQAVRLAAELEEWLGRKLTPTLVYDYPTIDALARFLAGETCPTATGRAAQQRVGRQVASRSRSSASAAGSRARRARGLLEHAAKRRRGGRPDPGLAMGPSGP